MARRIGQRTDRRTLAIVAGSVGLHAVVLGGLAFQAIAPLDQAEVAPPPVVYLDIEPRPLLRNERVRRPSRPAPQIRPASERPTDRATPSQLQLRAPAEAAPAPPPEVGQLQVAPAGPSPDQIARERLARSFQGSRLACSAPDLLGPAERAACADRFGQAAASAAPIQGSGNPVLDARLAREGARALAEYEARRRPLSARAGVVGPSDGLGSNFGIGDAGAHLDPSLRPDSTTNIRTRRDGPRAAGPPLTPGASSPRD